MPDQDISALAALTTPVAGDLLAIVDDPLGTPTTKKVALEDLYSNVEIAAETASDPGRQMYLRRTHTSALGSGKGLTGVEVRSTFNGDADALSSEVKGGEFKARHTTGNTYDVGTFKGVIGNVDCKNGTVTTGWAVEGAIDVSSGGTFTTAACFHGNLNNSGTVTNSYGIYVHGLSGYALTRGLYVDYATTGIYLDNTTTDIRLSSGGTIGGTAENVVIDSSGGIFINDTANAQMTIGLTINQGANDDQALALKSSDPEHGMTGILETNTYGDFLKADADAGGLSIRGWRDADGDPYGALALAGYLGETADTTKSAAGHGVIRVRAGVKSDSGVEGVGADGNLVSIESAAATRFLFDAEGEMHSDDIIGIGDDWDDWDDLALATDLSRLPKAKFDEMMKYKAEDFERAGLLTLSIDEDGVRHAFIKHKAMLQFTMCCFAEVTRRMEIYEQALLQLGVQPQLP